MMIVSGKSLFSIFPVSLISAPMPESAELRTCPRDFTWNEKTNKCYKFTNDRITWRMAREKCRNLGADLVSVQSQKEQRFIVDTARNSKGENYDYRFLCLLLHMFNPIDPKGLPSNMRYFPRISQNSLKIPQEFRAGIQTQSVTNAYLFIKTK